MALMEYTHIYDYLVVGGGTAGSVVATRLAEDSTHSVCLIEAGPTDAQRPDILSLQNWPNLLGTSLDYDYRIEPQARSNSLIRHSRGRMLGGCSSHNSCIAFCAPAYDMQTWQALGCAGWGADETKPYFERVLQQVYIDTQPPVHPLSQSFLAAAQQAGFARISFHGERELQEGAGIFQLNARHGLRQSSSQAYLHPLLATAPNLTVLTNRTAQRVLLDEQNIAYAVETSAATIGARREIIVCCGTFETPKLLLLSGIGPAEHLAEFGIPLRADVPGVGEHLLDHPEGVIVWETRQPVAPESTQYWEVGLFSTILPDSPLPDVMLHFGVVPFDWNTAALGYPTAPSGCSLTPNVPRAKSEGRVRLRSADPHDAPVIDCRYFTDKEGYDEALLLAGMKLARQIASQPALHTWIRRELAPGQAIHSDQELAAYARQTANTTYHPAGTCRMGESQHPLTVVDAHLRVKQVQRLRVADASIFPNMISVNPCLTCMMIGEKCADLVKQAQGAE
jgi:choline oxidase